MIVVTLAALSASEMRRWSAASLLANSMIAMSGRARATSSTTVSPGHRVRLEDPPPVGADDPELVLGPGPDIGDEELPNPAAPERAHRLETGIPPIGIAHQADPPGVGSPDREGDSADPLVVHHPRPEPAPELAMGPLSDEVEVDFAQRGPEAVGVVHLPAGVGGATAQPVAGQLLGGNDGL